MNVLSITPIHIISTGLAIIVLYITSFAILFKNKSGILPYLAVLMIPIIGALGIIAGNYTKK